MSHFNFGNLDPSRREHFVYRCFDEHGRLIYVGCTMNPDRRRREHRTDRKEWLPLVRRTRMAGPYTYATARRLEREALRDEYPMYGCTPQRRSADSRRNSWIRRHVDQDPRVFPAIPIDDYYAIHDEWSRKADEIDWLAIAERVVRSAA